VKKIPGNLYDYWKGHKMSDKPTPPLPPLGNDDDGEYDEITAPFAPNDVMGIAINAAQFYVAALEVLGPGNEYTAIKLAEGWTHVEHARLITAKLTASEEGE